MLTSYTSCGSKHTRMSIARTMLPPQYVQKSLDSAHPVQVQRRELSTLHPTAGSRVKPFSCFRRFKLSGHNSRIPQPTFLGRLRKLSLQVLLVQPLCSEQLLQTGFIVSAREAQICKSSGSIGTVAIQPGSRGTADASESPLRLADPVANATNSLTCREFHFLGGGNLVEEFVQLRIRGKRVVERQLVPSRDVAPKFRICVRLVPQS